MKRILFLSAVALSTVAFRAQVIEQDNYNTYTLGNVGTNTTFGASGQGGMYLNGGAPADYQIASVDATHGNSLQVTSGADGTAASNRQIVKGGFSTAWAARTAGNDVLKLTFDFYTGTSTGDVSTGINFQNSTTALAGIRYNSTTKLFTGQANLTSNATGTAGYYNITGISAVTFPANTWVTVGLTYDKVNGSISYTINGITNTIALTGYIITKNLDAGQMNIVSQVGAGNTAITTSAVDNYKVEAVNAASLGVVTVGQIEGAEADVALYPNPVTDVLNIKANSKVKSVSIIDITGKVVAAPKAVNNQVNVSALTSGTYILNVETEKGVQSKKFIKK